jgi:hypothetical protein
VLRKQTVFASFDPPKIVRKSIGDVEWLILFYENVSICCAESYILQGLVVKGNVNERFGVAPAVSWFCPASPEGARLAHT